MTSLEWDLHPWLALGARVLVATSVCLPTLASPADPRPGSAISHSELQGDPPPKGVSLFDQLFGRQTAEGITYVVPYPFEHLLSTLEQRTNSLKTVLIPLGRSLHREAPRPEYFRYPRIVLAVDGQSEDRLLTRDRLFLGYQERTQQIEVISYNEVAGRFEFQVVTDYTAGRRPAVGYARRTLCLSCHQNGAAIFPRLPWSETNFDPKVAEQIRARHPTHYHGVRTDRASGDAGFIDAASNRANLLSTYQRIWRDGCELPNDPSASRRCRADAFYAMLRYRLGVWSEGMPNATMQHEAYRRVIGETWRTRWPTGLAIPEADIPNRSPALESFANQSPPGFDPLSPRPPRLYWMAERCMDRAIEGLADAFLLESDIERLDRELGRQSLRSDFARTAYKGDCEVDNAPLSSSDDDTWINIRCVQAGGLGEGLDLIAELVVNDTGKVDDRLSWLYLTNRHIGTYAGLSGAIDLSAAGGTVAARLSLSKRRDRTRARTWGGAALSGVEFVWFPDSTRGLNASAIDGRYEITLTHDLDAVADAIAALLRSAESGTFDGFGRGVLRGVALMSALFDQLGFEHPTPPPALRLKPGAGEGDVARERSASPVDHTLALFQRHCGTCHGAPTVSPPGFLAGDPKQVIENIRGCAGRISFRLAMWQTRPNERPRTPMPPAAYLSAAALNAEQWIGSDEYTALREFAEGLRGTAGKPWLQTEYVDLPPC